MMLVLFSIVVIITAYIGYNQRQIAALKASYEYQLDNYQQLLMQQATIDNLTQLPNQKALQQILDYEAATTMRVLKPYALIKIELNDRHQLSAELGIDNTDFIIKTLAQQLRKTIRDQDVIGRWQDHRFLVLLPNTDLFGASHLALKLQNSVAQLNFKFDNLATKNIVGISINQAITCRETNKEDNTDLLEQLNICLHAVQGRGNNQIVTLPNYNQQQSLH